MITDKYKIGSTYISCTNLLDAKQCIYNLVKNGIKGYICVSNPRTVTYATKHLEYRKVMENSCMNLPDAEPMIWAAKLWGLKDTKRTMGPMLFHQMLSEPESGIEHFLLGDTNETLEHVISKFKFEANSKIVGSFSPPFCDLQNYDYPSIASMINESGADIVWISMRAPKQDFFAVKLMPFLRDGIVCIGVGAAFRFSIGEYKMPPKFIRRLGLMGLYWGKKGQTWWAFLWGYAKDNIPFVFYLLVIPFKRFMGMKYNE